MKSGLVALLYSLTFATLVSFGSDFATVLREAPNGWRNYLRQLHKLELRVTVRHVRTFDDLPYREQLTLILQRPGHRLQETTMMAYKGNNKQLRPDSVWVIGLNPDYVFNLIKNDSKQQWALKTRIPSFASIGYTEVVDRLNGICAMLNTPIELDGHLELSLLFEQPTFRIIDVKDVDSQDQRRIAVTFDNTHAPPTAQHLCPIQKGTIELLPSSNWCLSSYNIIAKTASREFKMVGNVSYSNVVSDVALPSQAQVRTDFIAATDTNVRVSKVVHEYDYTIPANVTEPERFRLVHYGIPEPVTGKELRLSIWVIPCFVLFGLVAFWSLFKRRSPKHGQ